MLGMNISCRNCLTIYIYYIISEDEVKFVVRMYFFPIFKRNRLPTIFVDLIKFSFSRGKIGK